MTMYPDRAARQALVEASSSQEASKDGQNSRNVNPLERKSCGSVTSELMREGFSRDGMSRAASVASRTTVAPSNHHAHSYAGPLTGGLWGVKQPARGEKGIVHASVGDLVQVGFPVAHVFAFLGRFFLLCFGYLKIRG